MTITSTRYLVLQSSILASGEVATGGVDDVGFGYVAPDELVLASVEEVDALRARVAQLEAALASPGCGEACPVATRLRAEVERVTKERDEARTEWTECLAEALAYHEDCERLREALRGLLDASPGMSGGRWDAARAALAGAPSETRREQDRALAERVREACITALAESDGDPRSLCDLDLDALLEEQ